MPTPTERSQILSELHQISLILLAQPNVLVHRDLQSSNILLFHGRPVLIDFQGLRLGAAAYDLASLLYDPYVMLSAPDRVRYLEHYLSFLSKRKAAALRLALPLAGVQRIVQALGAFGRLSANPQTAYFSRYIVPASQVLESLITEHDLPAPTLLQAIRRKAASHFAAHNQA